MTAPFVARIPRDVVVVRGPDATSFLQSLVSQDLDGVGVGETVASLLLQPQGKLVADFYAFHSSEDEWWLLCEAGFGETVATQLQRFKIRVQVEVESRGEEALVVRGRELPAELGEAVAIPVRWPPGPAYDVIGPAPAIDLPEVDAAGYERARILAGVPRLGADLDDRTIPQEAFLELDAVSFTKGCFLGQELVCRIDTRGHVNRLLHRLRAIDGASLLVGADVVADDRNVGSVTSSAGDVALAMLRREIEPGAAVRVGDAHATVEAIS
jgi:folate-binding protein YgfZ